MSNPGASVQGEAPRAVVNPGRVGTLRGARVEVDARRAGRVAVVLVLLSLAACSAALFVAGADKNAQLNDLHEHGVAVEVTVLKCLGLLGGSGSNAAGYACTGTYRVDGHRYDESIPGDTLHAPGTEIRAVAASDDPALFTTVSALAVDRSSSKVFVFPTVLLAALVLAAVALALRRRSNARRALLP